MRTTLLLLVIAVAVAVVAAEVFDERKGDGFGPVPML
jgi:hypothetical protein